MFGHMRLHGLARLHGPAGPRPGGGHRPDAPGGLCGRGRRAWWSQRGVELGPLVGGLRVIRSGLTPADRVIIDGVQHAQPGQAGDASGPARSRRPPSDRRRPRPVAPAASVGDLRRRPMKFAHFFVDRPVFAAVVSILITLLGVDRPADPAGRAVSADRPADGDDQRHLSRRLGRDPGLHRRPADRGADQRRRGHALHVLAVDRRRPPLDHRHLPARHRHRQGPGAGREPRGGRRAAAAGGGAGDRRGGAQGLARPAAGGAHLLARQLARSAVHLQLLHPARPRRAPAPAGRRRPRRPRRRATTRCGSGSIRTRPRRAT